MIEVLLSQKNSLALIITKLRVNVGIAGRRKPAGVIIVARSTCCIDLLRWPIAFSAAVFLKKSLCRPQTCKPMKVDATRRFPPI